MPEHRAGIKHWALLGVQPPKQEKEKLVFPVQSPEIWQLFLF